MKEEIKFKNRIELINRWLYSRGGRTLADVYRDHRGEFVYMGDGSFGETKVYIPTESKMKRSLLTKIYYPKNKNVSK